MSNDNNNNDIDKVIVSRIQHRRGLKQDLPQPLRPAELGLATDSRQVYIGGDPDDPASASYNRLVYFENTISAQDHTTSIVNNQLIAFSVPFKKYTKGEFNGITGLKFWKPFDRRTIIDSSKKPACRYSSSDYPVFSNVTIDPVETITTLATGASSVIIVQSVGTDATSNIRVGDTVLSADITGEPKVASVVTDAGTGEHYVTLTDIQDVPANSNITFESNNVKNFITGSVFTSDDVVVSKNGIRLVPEANNIATSPGAASDYVFSEAGPEYDAVHSLTLRTRPAYNDDVSVCYYGNTAVIQAINGIDGGPYAGNISPSVAIKSFNSEYDIPWYLQIPDESIVLSETSGLGYIALEQKHISAFIDGANVTSYNALTNMGHLLVKREDEQMYDIDTLVTLDGDEITGEVEQSTANLLQSVNANISPTSEYSYSYVEFTADDANSYVDGRIAPITSVANTTLAFATPLADVSFFRPANLSLSANIQYTDNGYTDNVSATQTIIEVTTDSVEGLEVGDIIRVFSPNGQANAEVEEHGFTVVNVNTDSFDVEFANIPAGANAEFTQGHNDMVFVNHGNTYVAGNTNNIQGVSTNHRITSDASNVLVVFYENDSRQNLGGAPLNMDHSRTTENTLLIEDFVELSQSSLPPTVDAMLQPYFTTGLAGSGNVQITPVFTIDVSDTTTVTEVAAKLDVNLVSTVPGGPTETMLVQGGILPQEDGAPNALFMVPNPAYTSIVSGLAAGGLSLTVYDDDKHTSSRLGLTPATYNRDTSVKAKLERWMNKMVLSRDVNLFTGVFVGNAPYSTTEINGLGDYYLTYNHDDLEFCTRQEASMFTRVVNNMYSTSAYDRSEDDNDGTRGLVNLKTNIELQTVLTYNEISKHLTYPAMDVETILTTDGQNDVITTFDTTQYNSYVVDYSITNDPVDTSMKYSRVGTLTIISRPDMANVDLRATITDDYTSVYEDPNRDFNADPLVEPAFELQMTALNNVQMLMTLQNTGLTPTYHNIGTNLTFKFAYRRWNSL